MCPSLNVLSSSILESFNEEFEFLSTLAPWLHISMKKKKKNGRKKNFFWWSFFWCYPVDAVYAMAHAVHRMIADVCGPNARELCDELKPAPSGRHLLKYIRNVNFIGKPKIPVQNFRLCILKKHIKQTIGHRSTGSAGAVQQGRRRLRQLQFLSISTSRQQIRLRAHRWLERFVSSVFFYFLFCWVAWSFIAGSCERERDDPASIRWCKHCPLPHYYFIVLLYFFIWW